MKTSFQNAVPILGTVVAVLVLLIGISVASADSSAEERVRVFITFDAPVGPSEQALLAREGGKVHHTFPEILPGTISVTLPEKTIDVLRRNPRIVNIEEVQAGPIAHGVVFDTELSNAWGVTRIGVGEVHDSGKLGSGISVAMMDSGVDYLHPDLNDTYAGGVDVVENDSDPFDIYGHGTHTMGTLCAEDNDNGVEDASGNPLYGVVGVSPSATCYAIRILNDNGVATYWDGPLAGLDWAVQNGIQVVGMPYGRATYPGTTVEQAYQNAYDAGLIMVASAGNSGTRNGRGDNMEYPARFASVISVGATDSNDSRASFSSTGSDLELMAPGASVYSTWNDAVSYANPQPNCHTEEGVPETCYKFGSGTSMSVPHVVGAIALMLETGVADSNNNGIVADEVRQILIDTAVDLGSSGWDSQYGYGLIDVVAAINALVPPQPVTDVAVLGVGAPTSVILGDVIPVTVTIQNIGNQDIISDIVVTLNDSTGGVLVGTQTISGGLNALESAQLVFNWDTTSASIGSHSLVAMQQFTDDIFSNDSLSTYVDVADGTGGPTSVHVGDIDGSSSAKGPSRWSAVATVSIHDNTEAPVSGAVVSGTWSGDYSGSFSGTTLADGSVQFSTGNMSGGSQVTLTVTSVTYNELTYEASENHDPDGDSTGSVITIVR